MKFFITECLCICVHAWVLFQAQTAQLELLKNFIICEYANIPPSLLQLPPPTFESWKAFCQIEEPLPLFLDCLEEG